MSANESDFSIVRRGYKRSHVDRHIRELRLRLESAEAERSELRERLAELGLDEAGDLQSELERVSADVGKIMQAAREAAEGMRSRAGDDAARWVGDARVEARITAEAATADAVAMRRDAWNVGSEMLLQAQDTAARLVREAEEETLMIQAQAEQEASRLTSSARREAEEERRAARFEAERIVSVANAEAQALVETAQRESESIQERVRAIERRRSELLSELDTTRVALTQVEAQIEDRRRGPQLPAGELQAGVRVMPSGGDSEPVYPDEPKAWQAETIRLVVQGDAEPESESIDPAELAAEIQALQQSSVEEQPELPARPPEDVAEQAPEEMPPEVPDEPAAGGVAGLFAALRGATADNPANGDLPAATETADADVPATAVEVFDAVDMRDRSILPVLNLALRGVKKTLVAVQNEALDMLRTVGDDWRPDAAAWALALEPDVAGLVEDAFASGVAAVAHFTEAPDLTVDSEPVEGALDEVASALVSAVTDAIENSISGGPRARNSAVSKVVRLWRADDAERRLRVVAASAYHRGMVAGAAAAGIDVEGIADGIPCAECPAGTRWNAVDSPPQGKQLPPAHATCSCTLAPVG